MCCPSRKRCADRRTRLRWFIFRAPSDGRPRSTRRLPDAEMAAVDRQGDGLSAPAMATDSDDLLGIIEVDPLDRYSHAEHVGLERQGETLLEHRQESDALLG